MTIEDTLLQRFGPLLSMAQLASVLDRSPDGLRVSLRTASFDLSGREKLPAEMAALAGLIVVIIKSPSYSCARHGTGRFICKFRARTAH